MQRSNLIGRWLGGLLAGLAALAGTAHAQNISGAIFTTTADGSTVNGNHYASKLDVYLNGGPQNCISPGLPPGDYYFMVTNPPGDLLLSHDSTFDRKFRVKQTYVGGQLVYSAL